MPTLSEYAAQKHPPKPECAFCELVEREECDELYRSGKVSRPTIYGWLTEDQGIKVSEKVIQKHYQLRHHLNGNSK